MSRPCVRLPRRARSLLLPVGRLRLRLRVPPYAYAPPQIRFQLAVATCGLDATALQPLARAAHRQAVAPVIALRVAARPQRRRAGRDLALADVRDGGGLA